MPPLSLVFMGTAPLAAVSLRALATRSAIRVLAVVTQPDRPRGRDLKVQPSPVKELALQLAVPVLQPVKARAPDFIERLRRLAPDLVVVAAYGQLLPPALLAVPRLGCLNVHASLLPKFRGASPIQAALLHDETETGATLMLMDAGLDTGPILRQARTPIHPDDDAQTLHDRLAQLGANLLLETLPDYAAGHLTPQPQPAAGASLAPKLKKEDGRLDWTQPARALWCRVRALTPWPGAFTPWTHQGRPLFLKLWKTEVVPDAAGAPGAVLRADKSDLLIACGQGALRVLELQREGGRRLNAAAFLAGHPVAPGERFG